MREVTSPHVISQTNTLLYLIGWNPAISAFVAGFAVTLEPEGRRSEIALFIMPRFFETLWNYLKRRGLVFPLPGGELLVFALAMGIINYYYQMEVNTKIETDIHSPFHLSSLPSYS